MKTTHNGKRYNSEKCEVIAERDHYNNGNYAGTTQILRASDGAYLIYCDANGQDMYYSDQLYVIPAAEIDLAGYGLTTEQEQRCVALGLIEIID